MNNYINDILKAHLNAMKERQNFTIPFWEDKYILECDDIYNAEIEIGINPSIQHKGMGKKYLIHFAIY